MAISDTISSMQTNTRNAYTAISSKGGTIPANKNLENLQQAINSIPAGGGGALEKLYVVQTITGNTCTLAITSTGVPSNALVVGQLVAGNNGKLYLMEE